MPFARPTLAELVTRTRSDLRGALSIGGPLLRRAMADVLGVVWAGAVHMLHGYLRWLALQLFATSAEREFLLRIGSLYGITPVPAQYATGDVTVTGTDGSVVTVGTILRLDSATSYSVTAGAAIASGTATVSIVALLAGSDANLPATASLFFESPIIGVSSTAVVGSGGIIGGLEEEGTEEVRDRILLRLRRPPTGGSDRDYEAWALAVPGVTRAWVYPAELGLGTVVVRFVLDGRPDIFPSVGEVDAVQVALDDQRPNTAQATAAAPVSLAVPLTLSITPDTGDLRAEVAAELGDLLARIAEPGDGISRGRVPISQIRTAIGTAVGSGDYTLTSPVADVLPGVGELPVVGAITWV